MSLIIKFILLILTLNLTKAQFELEPLTLLKEENSNASNNKNEVIRSLRGLKKVPVSVFGLRPFIRPCKFGLCGVDMKILQILAKKLDFDFDLRPQIAWGNRDYGTIGSVSSKECLIGIGQLTMSWSRYQSLDFTVPLYPMNIVMLSIRPRPLSPFLNLLRTFSREVWIFLLISAIAMAMLLQLVFKVEGGLQQRDERKNGFATAIFLMIRLLTSQSLSGGRLDSLCRNRQFWLLTLFLSTMMVLSFKSNLLANLLLKEYEPEIHNLVDAANQDRRFFITNGSNLEEFVSKSPLPVVQKLYREAVKHERYYFTNSDGSLIPSKEKEMVEARAVGVTIDTIFRAYKGALVQVLKGYPYQLGKDILLANYGAFVVHKDDLFVGEINEILVRLVDSGVIGAWIRRGLWSSERFDMEARNQREEEKVDVVISMEHVMLGFVLWACGIGIGIALLTLERCNANGMH